MDKQIQKLRKLINRYLNKSKREILISFGRPLKRSDNEIWFYNQYRWGLFKETTAFLFKEGKVIDIVITEYILWKEIRSIFYYEGQDPEYEVIGQLFTKDIRGILKRNRSVVTINNIQ